MALHYLGDACHASEVPEYILRHRLVLSRNAGEERRRCDTKELTKLHTPQRNKLIIAELQRLFVSRPAIPAGVHARAEPVLRTFSKPKWRR